MSSASIDNELVNNFSDILRVISSALSEKSENIRVQSHEPAAEIQKEIVISELGTKVNEQIEKNLMLENRIFSLEKNIAFLKISRSDENRASDSPSKRPKIDQDDSFNAVDSGNQEIVIKLKVTVAELDELKRLSKMHLKELDTLQSQNKTLAEELDSKKEQVIEGIALSFIKVLIVATENSPRTT